MHVPHPYSSHSASQATLLYVVNYEVLQKINYGSIYFTHLFCIVGSKNEQTGNFTLSYIFAVAKMHNKM